MSRNKPIASVILTTYNRSDILPRAIKSVLKQNYQDYELIIVDDHSTDRTEDVVNSFNRDKIKYIHHEQNRGLAAARNTGIRKAQGKYIAFLDDDDEWLPGKLEKQVEFLDKHPDIGMVYCGMRRIFKDGHVDQFPDLKGFVFSKMLSSQALVSNGSGVLIRASMLADIGLFDEKLKRGIDGYLFRKITQRYPVDYVNEILVNYYENRDDRITPVNTVAENKKCIEGIQYTLDEFSEGFKCYPKARAKRYFQLARYAYNIYVLDNDSSYCKAANKFVRKGLASHFGFKALAFYLTINIPCLWKILSAFLKV